ncbi:MAG: putative metalloprotease CJM1_0395 family protein [Hyphomicrobiales bacterium]
MMSASALDLAGFMAPERIARSFSSGTKAPPPERTGPTDLVELSTEGRNRHALGSAHDSPAAGADDLAPSERRKVDELKRRDQEVRAHEQAHLSAGAGIVSGGVTYQYQQGPDGKIYAVGGEVKIDVSAEKDPQATIRKMQQVRKAALAPAQPSSTDRSVAAQASQVEAQARMELTRRQSAGASQSASGAWAERSRFRDPSAPLINTFA